MFCLRKLTSLSYLIPFCSGHNTSTANKNKYRPAYLDHFEKKEQEEKNRLSGQLKSQREQQQSHSSVSSSNPTPQKQAIPPHRFQRSFIDGDYEFASYVSNFEHFFYNSRTI